MVLEALNGVGLTCSHRSSRESLEVSDSNVSLSPMSQGYFSPSYLGSRGARAMCVEQWYIWRLLHTPINGWELTHDFGNCRCQDFVGCIDSALLLIFT